MTKHKEKEEDIIEEKDIEKEAKEEISEVEHAQEDFNLKEELKEAEKKAVEYLDGWKRSMADFENYKKRQAQSQKDLFKYAAESVILQLLPVLDNFYASTDHIPEAQKNDPWVTGIMHIQKQLEAILADNGVSEIEVKIGDNFDPALHEAVADAKPRMKFESTNKIKQIILKGYRMSDRVIRPARVIVE